jgi:hypothetical protein
MKKFSVICLFLCLFFNSQSQYYNIVSLNGSTITTTNGNFHTGEYVPGEVYTLTICSDNPECNNIFIVIDSLLIGNGDFCVYNGSSVLSPPLGCVEGSITSFYSTEDNYEGCITIQFFAPETGLAVGGYIGCYFNCQAIQVDLLFSSPEFVLTENGYFLETCNNLDINLQAQAEYTNISYEQNDDNSQYYWTVNSELVDSGQVLSYSFEGPDIDSIGIIVVDQFGCSSYLDTPIIIINPEIADIQASPNNFSSFFIGDTINLSCIY